MPPPTKKARTSSTVSASSSASGVGGDETPSTSAGAAAWTLKSPTRKAKPKAVGAGEGGGDIASLGLKCGQRACTTPLSPTGPEDRGIAIQATATVVPLLSHDAVSGALRLLSTGDVHQARNLLRHDDALTVAALCRLWCEARGVKVPPALMTADVEELSESAKARVTLAPTSPLAFPFVVDDCGYSGEAGAPLVPLDWQGRRFASAAEFHAALQALQGEEDSKFPLLTYAMRVLEEEAWQDGPAVWRQVCALQLTIQAVINIGFIPATADAGPSVHSAVLRPERLEELCAAEGYRYRVVTGTQPARGALPTMVLRVAVDLLEGSPVPSSSSIDAPAGTINSVQEMLIEASRLQKGLRRGASLCSFAPLEHAIRALHRSPAYPVAETSYTPCSGARLLLWRLLMAALEDSRPYAVHTPSDPTLPLPTLVALSLLARADPSFTLPDWLLRRVLATARALHANDGPAALWPWRGWRWSGMDSAAPSDLEFAEAAAPVVRDGLRVALLALPTGKADSVLLSRYLGALTEPAWANRLRRLPPIPPTATPEAATAFAALDKELDRAAYDHAVLPNMLLYVQACMPFPPRDVSQHSLRALADLIWRLSSSLNSRFLRQHLAAGPAQELFRIEQFTDGAAGAHPAAPGAEAEEEAPDHSQPAWKTSQEPLRLTPHEEQLLHVIHSVQEAFIAALAVSPKFDLRQLPGAATAPDTTAPASPPSPPAAGAAGRPPSPHERRTAFLQLFGQRHIFSVTSPEGPCTVALTVAGTRDTPLLVQRLSEAQASDPDEQGRPYQFLAAGPLHELAVTHFLASGAEWAAPLSQPPPGFLWAFGQPPTVHLKVTRGPRGAWRFSVNGTQIPPFDASKLLTPSNRPVGEAPLPPATAGLVRRALYAEETPDANVDPVGLLVALDRAAAAARGQADPAACPAWGDIAAQSRLDRCVWRDVVIKFSTRNEADVVEVAPVARSGGRSQQAVKQLTEGTVLRVLYALCALYPHAVWRVGELRFQVNPLGAPFVHLQRQIGLLAFGCFDDGVNFETLGPLRTPSARVARPMLPAITTPLWSHQEQAVQRVVDGVLEGKRGFADASAVGAGKTLSALGACVRVAGWLEGHGAQRHGFLILVPGNDLLPEWVAQALAHTSGFHVIVQLASGVLQSRGVSNGGQPPLKPPRGPLRIDGGTLVVTTLARARDKPFTAQAGWDLVIVDECLSVQNDTALQTGEAWRQVISSRCGVLMLSATFFRSHYSKLFYMVRMLRSPLPRTEPYLNVLLREHIICFVPENRRKWTLIFQPVELPAGVQALYRAMVDAFLTSGSSDHRKLFTDLKGFLRSHFESRPFVEALQAEVARLSAEGRRCLIFANSDAEAQQLILPNIPGARLHGSKASTPRTGPLVVTVHKGSHGLNLQGEADCIICRPQPGDLVEQMKGRIDRPGQARDDLQLVVLFAADTVEEAEAANIKLCGRFFRQYLDPLSIPFQRHAVEASLSAHTAAKKGLNKRSTTCRGAVATAFHKQVCGMDAAASASIKLEAEASSVAPETTGISFPQAKPNESGASSKPKASKRRQPSVDLTDTVAVKEESETISAELPIPRRARSKSAASLASNGATPPASRRRRGAEEDEVQVVAVRRPREPPAPRVVSVPAPIVTLADLDMPQALQQLAERDPKLGLIIRQIGPPTSLIGSLEGDPFKALARSIVFQQLSTRVAAKIFERLADACGGEAAFCPATMKALKAEAGRAAGLSARKFEYLQSLADAFLSGTVSREILMSLPDDECMERLCALRGIGEWSVHMFMMFSLRRADVFPYGDLAVRKAFKRLYGCSQNMAELSQTSVAEHADLPKRKEMEAIADKWRPYRTVGSWYMWHVLETKEAAYVY
eukprot:EG_transcript_117